MLYKTQDTEQGLLINAKGIRGSMILSDKTILKMLAEKSLSVSPLEESQIQPASIDVRLGDTFSIVEDSATGILT